MADIVISLDWGQASLLLIGAGVTVSAAAIAVGKWVIDRTNKGIDAYSEEKMKNLATHQDIQKLVDQVRETERVKADISDRMWDRQQRWSNQRAVCKNIIEALSDFMVADLALGELSKKFGEYKGKNADAEKYLRDATLKAMDERNAKLVAAARAIYVGPLFVEGQMLGTLNGIGMEMKEVGKHPVGSREVISIIENLISKVQAAGREDSGLCEGRTETQLWTTDPL